MASTDFRLNKETQSLEELWNTISLHANRRANDNTMCKQGGHEYPLEIRERQLESLETLVNTIKQTHTAIKLETQDA